MRSDMGLAMRGLVLGMTVWMLAGAPGPLWAARPSAPDLLPEKTAVFFSVVDCPDLAQRFMNTSLGRMSQDPQVSPLVRRLYGSLAELVASLRDRIGLSLPELLAIPQGEFTFALVTPEEEGPAPVILLDTGTQLANARGLWQRVTQALEQSGAKRAEETVSGTVLSIYEGLGPEQRQVVFFEKDATLVLATSREAVKSILAAWNGQASSTLRQNASYAAVMRRCRPVRGEEPQILWYADPVALLRAIGQRNAGAQLAVAMLPSLGLDGLSGVGGTLSFDAGQFDEVIHIHLLLENPRSGVFDVLALEPTETTPEPWVPSDVVSYMTLRWNFKQSYKALTKVFDSIRGEGALAAEVKRAIEQPTGCDFAGELLPALDGRVTYFTWIERPVTIISQATLVGLKLKDPAPVRKALENADANNPGALERKSLSGKDYYQIAREPRSRNPNAPPRPRPCFAIVNDYFIFADRSSLLEKAISTMDKPDESLAAALDYKLVASKLSRQAGGKKPAMVNFNRPDESMRFLYDLAVGEQTRERLQRGAERNPFFRTLHSALEAHPLPPFEVLQRYFAPGGVLLVDDETGLHYAGFSLRRQ